MSKGDIYDTLAEAIAEHKDMREHRIAGNMDDDDDFDVITIVQLADGSWEDVFGAKITVTNGTGEDE